MNAFQLYRKAWRYASAPHLEPRLTVTEAKALLKKDGLMVRNTYDFDQKEENSFWYIIKDHFGGMEELSSNTRNKIRRAFESYDFKRVDKEKLLQQAYPIYEASMKAYSIHDRKWNHASFVSEIESLGLEADTWACIRKTDGQMIGFAVNQLWEEACDYKLTAVLPECKHNNSYPNYGMFYSMNDYYLGEKRLRYVTDGTRSITQHSEIQEYLIQNFNFRKAYCKLNVHYVWWMALAVKLLFPLRKIISLPPVKAILNMEAMQREQQ